MNSKQIDWVGFHHRLMSMSEAEFAPIKRLAEEAQRFAAGKTTGTQDERSAPESRAESTSTWRRNDPELTRLIAADYRQGLTQAEIAANRGVHVQTVKRHLLKGHQTVRSRQTKLTAGQLEEAKDLRSQGWSNRQLGERYGLAHTTIARILARASEPE